MPIGMWLIKTSDTLTCFKINANLISPNYATVILLFDDFIEKKMLMLMLPKLRYFLFT